MSDKPILFSAPMVRALLDGRKTQTRRVCQWTANPNSPPLSSIVPLEESGWFGDEEGEVQFFAGYAVGDRLWVRESWRTAAQDDALPPTAIKADRAAIGYEADCAPDQIPATGRKRSSLHMPRWSSRLTLTVTDVRVQRLQDISEADAISEGITEYPCEGPHRGPEATYWTSGVPNCGRITPQSAYTALWNSIHGPDAWAANPWVVALTFDVHRCNIDAMP